MIFCYNDNCDKEQHSSVQQAGQNVIKFLSVPTEEAWCRVERLQLRKYLNLVGGTSLKEGKALLRC